MTGMQWSTLHFLPYISQFTETAEINQLVINLVIDVHQSPIYIRQLLRWSLHHPYVWGHT